MYRELFDEKHKIIKFVTLTPDSRMDLPTGEYDGDILCEDCDNRVIGQYESYVKSVLYGGNTTLQLENFRKPDGLEFAQIKGLDYKKFKLFLLTMLWKSSVSRRDFFKQVRLGPYEEKIRKLILDGDPGSSSSYPCLFTSYRKHDLPIDLIMEPKKIRFEGKISYSFLINGILYVFKISEEETTDWILEASINEKGEMKIIHASEEKAKVMLGKFLGVNID